MSLFIRRRFTELYFRLKSKEGERRFRRVWRGSSFHDGSRAMVKESRPLIYARRDPRSLPKRP